MRSSAHAALLVALLAVGAAVWFERWRLAAALSALALVLPLLTRVARREWPQGLWLRGLAFGFIAAHVPVLFAFARALASSHCGERLCLHALRLGVFAAPALGLVGAVAYWSLAPTPPPPRTGVSARDLRP